MTALSWKRNESVAPSAIERGVFAVALSASSGTGPIVETIVRSEAPLPYCMKVWWISLCCPVCAANLAALPCTPRRTPACAAGVAMTAAAMTPARRTARFRVAPVWRPLRRSVDGDAFDHDVLLRPVARVRLERGDRVDDVHAVGDAPEHRVLAVEP